MQPHYPTSVCKAQKVTVLRKIMQQSISLLLRDISIFRLVSTDPPFNKDIFGIGFTFAGSWSRG